MPRDYDEDPDYPVVTMDAPELPPGEEESEAPQSAAPTYAAPQPTPQYAPPARSSSPLDINRLIRNTDWRKDEKDQRLGKAREQVQQSLPEEPTALYLARNVSFAGNAYAKWLGGRAQKRIDAGEGSDQDYLDLAYHERLQDFERDQNSTLGGTLAGAALRAPEFLAHMALGGTALKGAAGAVGLGGKLAALEGAAGAGGVAGYAARGGLEAAKVPFAPALWAERAIQQNVEAKRDPLDPRGLPNALAHGMIQMATFGALGKVAEALAPGEGAAISRIAAQSAAFPIANAIGSLASYALKLDAGYGTLEDVVKGRYGEALRHVAADAITGAAFATAHEVGAGRTGAESKAKKQMEEVADRLKGLAEEGVPSDQAAEAIKTPPATDGGWQRVRPQDVEVDFGRVRQELRPGQTVTQTGPDGATYRFGKDAQGKIYVDIRSDSRRAPEAPENAPPGPASAEAVPEPAPPPESPPGAPQAAPEAPKPPFADPLTQGQLKDLIDVARTFGVDVKITGKKIRQEDVLSRLREKMGETMPPDKIDQTMYLWDQGITGREDIPRAGRVADYLQEKPPEESPEPKRPYQKPGFGERLQPQGPEPGVDRPVEAPYRDAPDAPIDQRGPYATGKVSPAVEWMLQDKFETKHPDATSAEIEKMVRGEIDKQTGPWVVAADSHHAQEMGTYSRHATEAEAFSAMMRMKQQYRGSGIQFRVVHAPLAEEPAAPPSMLEKMKARGRQDVRAKPQEAEENPLYWKEPDEPAHSLKGLTPVQEWVYTNWRASGGNYRAMAEDPEFQALAKKEGRGKSHTTVWNIANEVHKKLGGEGTLAAAMTAEGRARLVEDGVLVQGSDLHNDPDTVNTVVSRQAHRDAIEAKIDDLVAKFKKGEINEAQLTEEHSRLHRLYQSGHGAEAVQRPEVPEPGPEPAPVQPERRGLPPGPGVEGPPQAAPVGAQAGPVPEPAPGGRPAPGGVAFGQPLRPGESSLPGGGQPEAAEQRTGPPSAALANEYTEAQRKLAQLPPILKEARQSDQAVYDRADQRLKQDPEAASKVVEDILRKPRPATSEESMLLLQRRVAVNNEYRRVVSEIVREHMGEKNLERFADLDRQEMELSAMRDKIDQAAVTSGSEWGRSGRLRRMLMKDDFSLDGMMASARAAKGEALTPEEIGTIKKLQERIAELEKLGDKGTENTPEAQGARIGSRNASLEFRQMMKAFRDAKLSAPQKVFKHALDALDASRSLITSLDLSAVLRQGGFFTFAHPIKAMKAFPEMLRSFGSERGADKAWDDLNQRPNAINYRRAGLYLSEKGSALTGQEEAFIGRLTEKIPLVSASERAYRTFLNRARADMFDSMSASLAKGGRATPEEMAKIGNFVNVATGRGDLGMFERAAVPLARVFFSPRYLASRFQLLTGQQLYGGTLSTRKLIATEYARAAMGIGLFYGAAKLMGGDDVTIEGDPRSSDFGKVRIGNTRIDPLTGLGQWTVFASRLGSGQEKVGGKFRDIRGPKATSSEDVSDVMMRFARSKLAPVPGAAIDTLAGKDVVGNPVTLGSTGAKLVTPIAMQDVYDVMTKDEGLPRGTAAGLLAILGMNTQVYARRPKVKR